jgi:MFS family permease
MAAAFLYWSSLYLYVPTLPIYAQGKTDDLKLIGVVLAMYGLWQALIRLPLGIAADWIGQRKPFIFAGLALSGAGAWMMGTAGGVNGLILGRAVTGFAAGAWVPLVVAFSGLFPAKEAVRATALLTLVSSLSRMMATAVTGTLNEWQGYEFSFYLALIVAVLGMIVLMPAYEKRKPAKPPIVADVGRLVSSKSVLLPAALNAVVQYAAWTATFSFFPILARQLGAGDVALSLMLSMNIGVVLLGNLLTTVLSKRIESAQLVYATFLLQAVGIGLAAASHDLWLIYVAQFCMGLASGIGYPVLMGKSIEEVKESQRTTAMGLHQAVYAIGMFAGPWMSGILADGIGLRPMFAATAAGCLLVGLIGTRFLGTASAPAGRP